jgi:3-deoxy-D-manno-octulosonic-acid transferase
LLVIVPRHIHRLSTILSDLKGITENIAVRSREETIAATTDIYIADTFGELSAFIAGAELVIMGGSFAPFGGQNIIEVAAAEKAVVFGPHMDNFKQEAEQFLSADAAIQVSDQAALKDVLHALLNDPVRVTQLGKNGGKLIEQHRDVANTYLTELQQRCKILQPSAQ